MVDDEETIKEITKTVGQIESKNILELKNSLYSIIRMTYSYITQNNNNKDIKKRCDEIKQYVLENYQDINLNVAKVGEHFGMSSRYLSRQFTEQTGDSLLKYINMVRINEAKKMLIDYEDLTENVIAEKVGFSNGAGLIRIFRSMRV